MNKASIILRCVISVLLFIAIPLIGSFIYNMKGWDGQNEVVFYLAGVIGSGCYWIGSNNN